MKKMRSTRRYAILLIFLIATQELCSARRIPSQNLKLKNDAPTSLQIKAPSRPRRVAVAAVLFGAALFIAVANIAFDIVLQIEGCCALYPKACEYQEAFDIAKDELDETSALIDDKWGLAQNLLTYVKYSSFKNEEIALELKRILQKYESIVETVDPEVLNFYNDANQDLKEQVEAKNATVLGWTDADIDTAFTSLFDTSLGRLTILSGLIGTLAEGTLTYLWNWYKTAKIKAVLKTDYGAKLNSVSYSKAKTILGDVDVKTFINDAAVAQRKADVSTTRGAKAMAWAANVMYVVQIGIEIWMAVIKIEQCAQVRDNVKAALDKIEPEVQNMTMLYAEVSEHYENMTVTYDQIKTQISDDEFLGYLESIKNLTDSSSAQSEASISASAYLTTYMDTIRSTTDYNEIYNMQDDLILALGKVTFTLDCYAKKVTAFSVITSRCATGEDTLQNIYDTVVNDFDTNDDACTYNASMKYTSYDDVKVYSDAIAAANGYNQDCLLNDAVLQDSVCSKGCDGYDDAEIAGFLDITTDQVALFKVNCPTTCPLTAAQVTQICRLAAFLDLATVVGIYAENDPALVEEAYNSC